MKKLVSLCFVLLPLVILFTTSELGSSAAVEGGGGGGSGGQGQDGGRRCGSTLFVFGDSYADTGNTDRNNSESLSWKTPYGITFPRSPTGRYSDGHVLTDYIGPRSLSLSLALSLARSVESILCV